MIVISWYSDYSGLDSVGSSLIQFLTLHVGGQVVDSTRNINPFTVTVSALIEVY